jgi:hypothetical protein
MLSCPVTYCNGNRLFASCVGRLVFQAVLDRELAIISFIRIEMPMKTDVPGFAMFMELN